MEYRTLENTDLCLRFQLEPLQIERLSVLS